MRLSPRELSRLELGAKRGDWGRKSIEISERQWLHALLIRSAATAVATDSTGARAADGTDSFVLGATHFVPDRDLRIPSQSEVRGDYRSVNGGPAWTSESAPLRMGGDRSGALGPT